MSIKEKIIQVFRKISGRSKREEDNAGPKYLLTIRDRDGRILRGTKFETVNSVREAVSRTRELFAENGNHDCDRVDVHSMGDDVGFSCSFGRVRLMKYFKEQGWKVSIHSAGIVKIDPAYSVDSD